MNWTETRTAQPADAAALPVDSHDLHLNGWPAVQRAIARLEAAHKASICELHDRIGQLEFLWSEEIMRQETSTALGDLQERLGVLEELLNGALLAECLSETEV